jgi:hypothetical protein
VPSYACVLLDTTANIVFTMKASTPSITIVMIVFIVGEYRIENPEGYAYTQFFEHLSRYIKRGDAVMHFVHQPWHKAAGKIYDDSGT